MKRICGVPGCPDACYAKGYCERHYRQVKKHGKVMLTIFDPNEYVVSGDVCEIILTDLKGRERTRGIIDLADRKKAKKHRWYQKSGGGYIISFNGGNRIRLSRFLLDAPATLEVDHRNHNLSDNRRENLRLCTHVLNMQNKQSHTGSTSQFKGIYWEKTNGKWRAQIKSPGQRKHLGYFWDEHDAARAYDMAAKKHFGDFAYLNFP